MAALEDKPAEAPKSQTELDQETWGCVVAAPMPYIEHHQSMKNVLATVKANASKGRFFGVIEGEAKALGSKVQGIIKILEDMMTSEAPAEPRLKFIEKIREAQTAYDEILLEATNMGLVKGKAAAKGLAKGPAPKKTRKGKAVPAEPVEETD